MVSPSTHPLGRVGAIGVVLTMVAMLGATPVAAAASSSLYVSKEHHSSDANPCTASKPCLTIGHAVSIAQAGATIYVDEGTYAEQVSITKQLTLKGEDSIIDAAGQTGGIQPLVGYGLLVFGPGASGSVVEDFTVEHAIGEGILVAGTSKVRIEDNTVKLNDAGFGTSATFECKANGNIPGDCGEGLHLASVTWSWLVGNVVENNVGGILITDEFGPSAHNVISHNVARNNRLDCGITLPSHNALAVSDPTKGGVYDNLIIHNVSEGNGGAGVGMFAPFPGTASYNNRIIDNTLRNNGEAGVGIHAHAPGQNVSGNVIRDNTISGNGIDPDAGSGHPVGIALLNADLGVTVAVTVANNHIANEYWGIFRNGSFAISGLSHNHYAKSVNHHTN